MLERKGAIAEPLGTFHREKPAPAANGRPHPAADPLTSWLDPVRRGEVALMEATTPLGKRLADCTMADLHKLRAMCRARIADCQEMVQLLSRSGSARRR